MNKMKFTAILALLIMTCALWSPLQAASVKTSKGGYNYASKTTAMCVRGHKCHKHHHHGHRHHHKHHLETK